MSYCRWSSDDFGCDLYVYASDSGYTIHVAARRVVGDVPKVPNVQAAAVEEWVAAYQAQAEFLKTAKRQPIGGAWDGSSLYPIDARTCLASLKALRDAGYRFPDSVLADIAAEAELEDTP